GIVTGAQQAKHQRPGPGRRHRPQPERVDLGVEPAADGGRRLDELDRRLAERSAQVNGEAPRDLVRARHRREARAYRAAAAVAVPLTSRMSAGPGPMRRPRPWNCSARERFSSLSAAPTSTTRTQGSTPILMAPSPIWAMPTSGAGSFSTRSLRVTTSVAAASAAPTSAP